MKLLTHLLRCWGFFQKFYPGTFSQKIFGMVLKFLEMKKVFSYVTGGRFATQPTKDISYKELLELFTKDESIRNSIHEIQNLNRQGKETEAKELKNKLPYFLTAGVFTYRNDASLKTETYTYLVGIDIDKKDNPNVDWVELRQNLISIPSVVFVVTSPRGKGLKGMIRLKEGAYEPSQQYEICKHIVYPYLENILGVELDNRQAPLSQPFYLTHDKNLWHNKNPEELDINYNNLPVETIISNTYKKPQSEKLKNILEIIEGCENGKWDIITRSSYLIGGLVAGKILTKEKEVLQALLSAAEKNPFIEDMAHAKNSIIKSFNNGKSVPISQNMLLASEANKVVEKIFQKILAGDSILTYSDKYIMVGDDFFELANGRMYPRKEKTITLKHTAGILPYIKKYTEFVNEPDFINPQKDFDNNYNIAGELKYKPSSGSIDTTTEFLTHFFVDDKTDHFELGLDYLQLLYTKPKQKLPILCFVSYARETGKTTFLNWLNEIYGNNMAIIDNNAITSGFNAHWVSKVIIAVDESHLKDTERLKLLCTQKKAHIDEKYQSIHETEFHGKLILCSNNEDNFAFVEGQENRFWVRKLYNPKNKKVRIEEELKKEIPAFLEFLNNRQIVNQESTRLWFDEEVYTTDALLKVKEGSKSELHHELNSIIFELFLENDNLTSFKATPTDFLDKLDARNFRSTSTKQIATSFRRDCQLEEPEKLESYIPFGTNEEFELVCKEDKIRGKAYLFTKSQFVK